MEDPLATGCEEWEIPKDHISEKFEKGVRDHLGLLTAVKTSVRCKSTENTGIKWVSWCGE